MHVSRNNPPPMLACTELERKSHQIIRLVSENMEQHTLLLMGCVALDWTDKFVAIAQHQPLEFIVKLFEPDIKFPESVSHCAMME